MTSPADLGVAVPGLEAVAGAWAAEEGRLLQHATGLRDETARILGMAQPARFAPHGTVAGGGRG